MQDGLGIGKEAQNRWADQQAGGEIAQNRSKAEPPEQWYGNDGRPHQDDRRSDHLSQARFSHRKAFRMFCFNARKYLRKEPAQSMAMPASSATVRFSAIGRISRWPVPVC